jgi:hypothetical protein
MKLLTTILTEYQDRSLIDALPHMLVGFAADYDLETQTSVLPEAIRKYRKAAEHSFGEFRPWAGFEYTSFGDQSKIPSTEEDSLPKKGEYVQMVRGHHPNMPIVEQWRQGAAAQPLDAFAPDEQPVTNPNVPPEITKPKSGVVAPSSMAETGAMRGKYMVRKPVPADDQDANSETEEAAPTASAVAAITQQKASALSAELPISPLQNRHVAVQSSPLVIHRPVDEPAIPGNASALKSRGVKEPMLRLPDPYPEVPASKPSISYSPKDSLRRPEVPIMDPWGDIEAMDRGLAAGVFATSPNPVPSNQTARSGISNPELPASAPHPNRAPLSTRGQGASPRSMGSRVGGYQQQQTSRGQPQQRARNQLVDLGGDTELPRATPMTTYTGGVLKPLNTSTGTSTAETLIVNDDEEIRNRPPQYIRLGPRPRGLVEQHQQVEEVPQVSAYRAALERLEASSTRSNAKSSERLQGQDEVKSRQFHRTMGQQKPKSGKSGPSKPNANKLPPKKDDKAKEDEARQAMINASWGEVPRTNVGNAAKKSRAVQGRKVTSTDGIRDMSPSRATEDSSQNTVREVERTTALIQSTLAGARCFTGQLSLVVDIGKVLIHPMSVPRDNLKSVQAVKEFRNFLTPKHDAKPPETAFLDKVTTSGKDCAYIVDLCLDNGDAMFSAGPYGFEVVYEFLCKTTSDEEVVLSMYEVSEEVAEDGTIKPSHAPYTLDHPTRPLGIVNYHIMCHIWDARMAVKATLPYEGTKEQNDAAQSFVDSIIVPKASKSVKLFAEVPTRELQIIDINMRRWTRFACEAPHDLATAGPPVDGDGPKFYLQVTETQALHWMKRGSNLRQIYAYAESDEAMVKDNRLWYQVSIGSTVADQMLFENVELPLGGVAEWKEGDIIDTNLAQSVVDIAKEVVARIDGVGFHNHGPGAAYVDAGKGSVITSFARPVQTVGGAYVVDNTHW